MEVDNSGVIEGEELLDLPMGDPNKDSHDDDINKANELRYQNFPLFR